MRARHVCGVLVIAASLFVAVSIASACESVGGSVSGVGGSASPARAGPNDPITYSISGLDSGARYRVTLPSQQVDSGINTVEHGTADGTFAMPDYGDSPRTVFVTLYATHSDDNFEWNESFPVQYVPPVAAPNETKAPSSPAPAQPQRTVKAHKAKQQQPVAVADQGAKGQRHDSSSTGSATGSAPADPVSKEVGPSEPSSGSGKGKRSAQETSTVPDRVLGAIGGTTSVGPAKVPTMGLLLMAVIFVAASAVAAFLIYLFRSGPDLEAVTKSPEPPGPDPVEAELQGIIADEMARKLLSDLDLTEKPLVHSD